MEGRWQCGTRELGGVWGEMLGALVSYIRFFGLFVQSPRSGFREGEKEVDIRMFTPVCNAQAG